MDLKDKLSIFSGDILGGLNAAIITLPQALAFGVATGFGASAGIWGAIILCFVAGIFGTKIPMISGVTGPVAIVTASIMSALHNDINSVLFIICMAGVLQILLSMTKLPDIVRYVPYPVISGFMNGVGVIIILLQINPLFGIKASSSTLGSIELLIKSLNSVNMAALAIGCLTLFIVFFFPKRWNKYVPSQILALIICTILSVKLGLNIERISQVSVSLPAIRLPHTDIHGFVTYFQYSIMLAVILSSESLLTGLVCTSITKSQLPPNKLLLGQGLGNICCAFTGTIPGSAATMRSVAALKSGASSKFAAVVTSVILIMLIYNFAPFVAQIPLAVLAAILIKIGYDIIDTKFLKVIKLAPKDDLYVLTLVFLLTVFYNLIVAVGAGIILAALLYAKKAADKTKLVSNIVYDEDIINLEKAVERDYMHKIRVVHINGSFFFGSATQLISKFDEFLGTRFLIIVYDSEDLLDISAIFALEDIILRLKDQHINVMMVIKNESVHAQLAKYKINSQIDDNNIFLSEVDAINNAKSQFKDRVEKKYFS